jgi:hypothetical protein
MLDTKTRPAIQLEIECPLCNGSTWVGVPRPAISAEEMSLADVRCGCEGGRVTVRLDPMWLTDPLADAVTTAIDELTRNMDDDDRDFLRDDMSSEAVAKAILPRLVVTLSDSRNVRTEPAPAATIVKMSRCDCCDKPSDDLVRSICIDTETFACPKCRGFDEVTDANA